MTTALLLAYTACFGLVFGSFATVLASRVPDEESIGGRSRCPSCGAQIAARDNIPVISWLLLRGRCRSCGTTIAWTYPVIELTTAALFVFVVAQGWPIMRTLAWLWCTPTAVALAVIDFRLKRLPNALTWPAFGGATLLLVADAGTSGDWASLRSALIGALALSGFYLALNLLSRGGMGMGDVKLALTIGLLTGYAGWKQVISASFIAFLVGATVGIVLMAMKRAGRKTALPFGPFMLLGLYASLLVPSAWVDLLLPY